MKSGFYCKRFAQSAAPGSEKGPLLERIFVWLRKGLTFGAHFRTRGALLCNFWLIFGHWEYFGSAGGRSLITKTAWTTKGAPRGISPKMVALCWIHFGVIFCVFFDLWGSVFKLRFLLISGTDFSWNLASFRHIFLIFVCTCRHLWFKWFLTTLPFENAFLASPRVSNLIHFQHVLFSTFLC